MCENRPFQKKFRYLQKGERACNRNEPQLHSCFAAMCLRSSQEALNIRLLWQFFLAPTLRSAALAVELNGAALCEEGYTACQKESFSNV